MLKDLREDRYDNTLEKVIEQVERSGFSEIKAEFKDLEKPAALRSQKDDLSYIPDATGVNSLGRKAYFEIGRKVKDTEKLASKWKLLETLANIKEGVFKIFVPHGSMKFTKEIVEKYHINAEIVKI